METRANYLLVASFMVVIVAGTIVAAIWMLNLHPIGSTRAFYDIYFRGSVVGLKVDAPVSLAGIPIGNVCKIEIDPADPAQVHVTIETRKDAAIRSDSIASLDVSLVFGDASISITGGSENAPPAAALPGHAYPIIASQASQLTATWAEDLLQRTIEVSDALRDMLDDKGRQAIAEKLQATEQMTARGVGTTQRLGSVIDDFDATVRDVHAQATALTAKLNDLSHALATVETQLDDADPIVKKVTVWTRDFDNLVQGIRPEQVDLTQNTLRDLRGTISQARQLISHLARYVDDFERDPMQMLFGKPRTGYQPK
ncbi:MAG TPA: MlaD family protein [Stellaceae bacterium]|nr:MlaD family protein [Stellaceae bacterium]